MNLISHTFLALAAAVMAAGPVLSCCAAGHTDATSLAAGHGAEMPPCHGAPDPQPLDECGGCASCATSAAAPELVVATVLLVTYSDLDDPGTRPEFASGVSLGTPPEATGPPPRTPFAAPTPISLRQRLLI